MTSDPDAILSGWLARSARRRRAQIDGVERVSRAEALGAAGEMLVAGAFFMAVPPWFGRERPS